ncbi:MAG: MotA/TolQ/ExbB proton channel family protein [Deltaproteobacteria bacterium]|jgi:biopolymer transport protein ExbB/TolQ|nr:MotA/TolQ/ExbB proton channel family protein [Deltaproteobacteria bacterium]
MDSIAEHFHEGGAFMYPIAALGLLVLAIVAERTWFLYFKTSSKRDLFLARMRSLILERNVGKAVQFANQEESPLGRIVKAGLVKVNRSDDHVQAAMDEAALEEIPRIERRTGFLPMLSNVATLMGLLGTISGLIQSFAAVSDADAATKATLLSKGISEAMNCTAFGLIVAIPALVFYAFLQSRTQRVIDDINAAAVSIVNLVVLNRDKLGIAVEPDQRGGA